MKDKILLIDSHNFIYRGFVTFGEKKDPNETEEQKFNRGVNTLIYNFFRNLRPIIELFSPNKVFLVREGHPQFRYNLFDDYKGNRIVKTGSKDAVQNDKFHKAKNKIFELCNFVPLTVARASNYECDDTISSLCTNMASEDITIVSNDSDFIQLLQRKELQNSVKIYNSQKKEYFENPNYHYITYKSLKGDTSDNIPGIFTSKKDIAVIESLSSDPQALNKLLQNKEINETFQRNYQLIKFADVPIDEINLIEGTSNFNKLKEEFTNLNLPSLITDKYWDNFIKTFNCISM